MTTTPSILVAAPEHVVARLSKAAYSQLSRQALSPLPIVPADQIQAGFRCGVEFVLMKLREGFVIEDLT